jgi:hypothetical protein
LKKLTKNRTLDWLSTGFTVNSTVADIFNIGMKYSTDEPYTFAVFDEQHINSFKGVFIPRASGRDIFKVLLERYGARRGRWEHYSYG